MWARLVLAGLMALTSSSSTSRRPMSQRCGITTTTANNGDATQTLTLTDQAGRTVWQSFTPSTGGSQAGGLASATYSYDGDGRMQSAVETYGTINLPGQTPPANPPTGAENLFDYDNYGRLTAVHRNALSGSATPSPQSEVDYAYPPGWNGFDQPGTVIATRYNLAGGLASQHKLSYGYDGIGRVTSLQSWTPQSLEVDPSLATWQAMDQPTQVTWETPSARFRRMDDGSLTELTCYNGLRQVSRIVSGPSGQITGLTCTALQPDYVSQRFDYAYDVRGNRLSEAYSINPTLPDEVTKYGYDAADRLTGVQYGQSGLESAELYRLSGTGTRLGQVKVTGLGGDVPLGPDAYNDAVQSQGSFTAGTPVETKYQYNDAEQLTGITDGTGATIGTVTSDSKGRITELVYGTRREKYYWNAADRMIAATQLDSNNAEIADSATYYGYDYQGYRVSETQASDPTHPTGSVWSQGELLDEGPDTGTGAFYERAGQMVVAENGNRVIHDALGSVTGTWNGTGFDFKKYDAWGGYQEGTAPAGPPSMGYTGHLWDSSASLVYAKARWYVPELGRFTSEDPLGWEGRLRGPSGLMPFGYANGNPLEFFDPTGTWTVWGTTKGVATGTYEVISKVTKGIHNIGRHPLDNTVGIAINGVVYVAKAVWSPRKAWNAAEGKVIQFNNYANTLAAQCRTAEGATGNIGDETTSACVGGLIDLAGTTYLITEGGLRITSGAIEGVGGRFLLESLSSGNPLVDAYRESLAGKRSFLMEDDVQIVMQDPTKPTCVPSALSDILGSRGYLKLVGMFERAIRQGGYTLRAAADYLRSSDLSPRVLYVKDMTVERLKAALNDGPVVVNVKLPTGGLHAVEIANFRNGLFEIHDSLLGPYTQTPAQLAPRLDGQAITNIR